MRKSGKLLVALAVLALSTQVSAAPLAGEYTVNTTATKLGANSWNFTYNITNNNQQTGYYNGLDGFYVAVPDSAVISNIITPASAHGGDGWWYPNNAIGTPTATPEAILPSNYHWAMWWGAAPASVYPIGSTATFGFQADNVTCGQTTGAMVTYWGWDNPNSNNYIVNQWGIYSGYSSGLTGPAPTPEPASMLLLGSGLVGLIGLRRKSG